MFLQYHIAYHLHIRQKAIQCQYILSLLKHFLGACSISNIVKMIKNKRKNKKKKTTTSNQFNKPRL